MTEQLDPELKIDAFHFLVDRLRITPESRELEEEFKRYVREPGNEDEGWLALMEGFADKHDKEALTENTYNGENAVSQKLQYTTFDKDGHTFVLLQVHGGADVCGGYTEPYVFEMGDKESLMDNAMIYAYAGDKHWDSDDSGYSWQYEGTWSKRPEWLANPDVAENGVPSTWDVTEEGVFYRPTGRPISFSTGMGDNAPQWWELYPRLVARYAPQIDERQSMLKKKRLRS
jgi:hypothetical protein